MTRSGSPGLILTWLHRIDDMLAILFPHMYEDFEYLLPPEDSVRESETLNNSSKGYIRRDAEVNAVAGPSKLTYHSNYN